MVRCWLVLRLGLLVLALTSSAHAWLSLQVASDATRLEISPRGEATVTHDLLLEVRGGPLRAFTVAGVDADAKWVGIPTITKAKSGELAGLPIHLTPVLTGDTANFALQYAKGVGSGQYIVHFAYTTDLGRNERVRVGGNRFEITWQSPRFEEGVDGMRLAVAVPSADPAPRLVEGPALAVGKAELVETPAGVVVAELRREGGQDLLQLTRPHVARKEQAIWRISLADTAVDFRDALPVLASSSTGALGASVSEPVPLAVEVPDQGLSVTPWVWLWVLAGAVGYAGLIGLKFRSQVKPLVQLKLLHRVGISFLLFAVSLSLALVWEFPTLAVLALIATFPLAIASAVALEQPARGPGQWRRIEPEAIQFDVPIRAGGARWFDVGSTPGLLLCSAILLIAAVVGLRCIGVAPYYSAMTLVYSAALAPLFCTFGGATAQSDAIEQHLHLQRFARLLKRRRVPFTWQARHAEGCATADELRLEVATPSALSGLVAVEIGVESVVSFLRRVSMVVVLVRVRLDSPAEAALPRNASFCRGRVPEERVFLLRPALPVAALSLELLLDCRQRLTSVRRAERSVKPRPTHSAAGVGAIPRSAAPGESRRAS